MKTFLFDSVIIGPIRSRRLGCSLGVNLLSPGAKLCNFDCIYCECGWNGGGDGLQRGTFCPMETVVSELEDKLKELQGTGSGMPDVITFAGNGEPTMHPDFAPIIGETLRLRDRYAPGTKVAVLSNATMIDRAEVREALRQVDRNILKFDSAVDETYQLVNQPQRTRSVREVIELLREFDGELVIQTMFLRGEYRGRLIDNTTEAQVKAWIEALQEIRPKEVMLYTIDRATAADGLQKVSQAEMAAIAQRLRATPGLEKVEVSVAD